MIRAVLGVLGIKALALSLPEKAIVVGPLLVKGRLGLANKADNWLKLASNADHIDPAATVAASKQVAELRRTAKDGWSSKSEFAALGEVSRTLLQAGANAARSRGKKFLDGAAAAA